MTVLSELKPLPIKIKRNLKHTSSISLSLLEAQSKDISTFATNSLIKVPLLPAILFNYFKFKWLQTFCIRTCSQAGVLNRYSNKSLDCFLCPWKFVSWKISAKDTCFLTGTTVCFIYQLEKSPSKGICRLIFENNLSYFIYELFFRIWIISNNQTKNQRNCTIIMNYLNLLPLQMKDWK